VLKINEQTYYCWRKEYGGLDTIQAKKLRELEKENVRLKNLVADLSLDNAILKEVLSKSNQPPGGPVHTARAGYVRMACVPVCWDKLTPPSVTQNVWRKMKKSCSHAW